MKCTEEGCGGELDPSKSVILQIGCRSSGVALPCIKCGRLYWDPNRSHLRGPVFHRDNEMVFLVGDQIVSRDDHNKPVGEGHKAAFVS